MSKKPVTVQIGTGAAAVDLVIDPSALESFARCVFKAMKAEREAAATETR